MLSSYFILGLGLDVADEEIRKRYLELIKQYTPEKDPNRFQEITSAYEQIIRCGRGAAFSWTRPNTGSKTSGA